MVKKLIICYLVMMMFIIGIAPRLEAAFSPSEALLVADRAGDLQKVRTVLESRLIQQRLQDLGYTADEIQSRLSQLSDDQLHTVAQKLDDLKVGQDSALGIVIAVLVIIILVIVVINLTSGKKVTVTR